MRIAAAAALTLSVVAAAGCGGAQTRASGNGGENVSGLGMTAELPPGWVGRIRLSPDNRPVLQAANFPLSANDSAEGEIAQESMGNRAIYLNLSDDGPSSEPDSQLPIELSLSDFGPPRTEPGYLGRGHLRYAYRELVVKGRKRSLAVGSGPAELNGTGLEQVNQLLGSVSFWQPEPRTEEPVSVDGETLSGYGMSMRLPSGWDGSVSRGVLEAANFALPAGAASKRIGPEQVLLTLREHGRAEGSFVTSPFPVAILPSEFVPPGGEGTAGPRESGLTGRSFAVHGREFLLWIESASRPPSEAALKELNAALSTLQIERGDFYPGSVEPATFAAASGWHAGSGRPAEIESDGEQTWTWAGTVPVRDEPFSFAQSTLETLPDDGIVIIVSLSRNSASPPTAPDHNFPVLRSPYRLADAQVSDSWEGQVRDLPMYAILSRVPDGQYNVDIRVFFGRPHPTAEQLARAQAELDRLRLPDWGPWELH